MMLCAALYVQAQIPYAVFNDGTLTFYYDNDKDSREGTVYTTFSGSSSSGWYSNRSNITAVVFDASFAAYRPASTSSWFYNCTNLTSIQGLEYLNTENVTSMSSMFRGCSSLTSLDLSKFKTDQVTDMSYMFENCSKLTSLDLSSFNTQNVTSMSYMFYGCSGLTSLDLSSFNTEMVTNMRDMFYVCSNLETIYVGEGWNTEKVTKGGSMFYRCTKIQGEDYTQYSSSATDVSAAHYGEGGYLRNIANKDAARAYAVLDGRYLTFYYDNQSETHAGTIYRTFRTDSSTGGWAADASNIVRVIFDDSFADFHGVKNTAYWFNCPNLIVMRGLANLNTENVTDMKYMFYNCNLEEIDLSKFNTGKVTDMTGMFSNCSKLTSLDVSGFNTENVTSMGDYSSKNHFGMFSGCSSLTSLDLSKFKTDQVNDMSYMFYGCSGLTSLDVSSFNTQNVTSMNYMFHGCGSLTSLDLSNFETKNVTRMYGMFYSCSKLTSLDLSRFNTEKVTNMGSMFAYCRSLTSLDLSSFDTKNVADMSEMFNGCSGLTSLDLSSFNTEIVQDMGSMFYNCRILETIYVGEDWITGNVDNSTSMFYSCPSLVGQDGTKYNSSYTDKTKAHYGEGGYLTYTDNRKRATVTTNAGGWASFTPEFHCQMSEGATAYIVNDINATEKKVIARSVMTMEKGSGYFVKGEPNTEYTATATGMVTTPTDGNKVVGCPTATVLDSSKSANAMYFLGVKGTTAGLYYVSGTLTIPAGKAYLQSDSPLILSAKELSIEIEGEETAIVNVNENDNGNGVRKVVRDGGLMIENGNGAYGISGVRKY